MSDLINRQLLIGAIEKCGEEKIYPQALIQTIKALPSADRPKGKWLDEEMPTCSICGKWIDVLQGTAELNFCPNCGADMRGEEND